MLIRAITLDFAEAPPPQSVTVEGFRDYVGTATFGDSVLVYPREAPLVRQYRPADEVLSDKAIASLKGQPVTDDHPDNPLRAVTPANAATLTKGTVLDAWRDGDKLRVRLRIYDAALMQRIAAGKVGLSVGYGCDTIAESGVAPDGKAYDAVQRGHLFNHTAFVDIPRDHRARITQDSITMDEIIALIMGGTLTPEDLAKIKATLDKVAPPAPPTPPVAVEIDAPKPPAATVDPMAARMDAIEAKLDSLMKGKKGDAADLDVDTLAGKVLSTAAVKLRSLSAARDLASPVLGAAKVDGMDSVNEIHRALVIAVFPEQKPAAEAAFKADSADVLAALALTARAQFNKTKADDAAEHLDGARSRAPIDRKDIEAKVAEQIAGAGKKN